MSTYLQMQDEVLAYGFDANVYRTRIKVWLNDAQSEIARRAELPELLIASNINTVSGTVSYTLPTDLVRLSSAVNQFYGDSLDPTDDETVQRSNMSGQNLGMPSGYCLSNTQISFTPIPDAAYTITLNYYGRPVDLVADAAVSTLNLDYHKAMIRYAVAEAYMAEDDDQMHTYHMNRFEQTLMHLATDRQAVIDDAPVQIGGYLERMRGTPVRQIDFTGGLNTKAAPYLVEPNECRDCLNVVTTSRGSIKKRAGNSSFATTGFNAGATSIRALFGAVGVPTAGNVLIAADEDGEYYSISTSGTVTDIAGAAIGGEELDTSIIQAPVITGEGPIYISNDSVARQWTGSGNIATWSSVSGTVPTGKYMVYFKNRVWVAGNAALPSRLYFSDISNPRVWPVANVVDFGIEDGEVITGIGTAGPYLLVFKTSKIYVVYDLDTGANRPLSSQLGCASHRSICESPKGTFFLSKDKGIWVTDGKKLTQISEKITPTIEGIIDAQRVRACGSYLNDHYYLSICTTGSTNNLTLDYDTITKSWWQYSNFSNQFALWRPTDEQQLYSAIPTDDRVDRVYDPLLLQDNTANFECSWTGPWLAWNEPYRNKRVRQIHVDGTGIVDAYIARDFQVGHLLLRADIFNYSAAGSLFGGGEDFGGEGIFGDAQGQASARLYSLGVGRAFSFKIAGTSAQPFEMDAYTPMIKLRQN